MLLLKGPAGCGKTMTLDVLAKEMEFEIILATSGTTAPTVTGIDYLFDDLSQEKALI